MAMRSWLNQELLLKVEEIQSKYAKVDIFLATPQDWDKAVVILLGLKVQPAALTSIL